MDLGPSCLVEDAVRHIDDVTELGNADAGVRGEYTVVREQSPVGDALGNRVRKLRSDGGRTTVYNRRASISRGTLLAPRRATSASSLSIQSGGGIGYL